MAFNRIPKFMAAGAIFFTGVGASIGSAQAALLDFSFQTNTGGNGSFTLNTDILDMRADPFAGNYPSAILNAQYNGTPQDASITAGTLNAFYTDAATGMQQYQSYGSNFGFLVNFQSTTVDLVNQLASDPSIYQSLFAGGTLDQYDPNITDPTITSLTVIAQQQPPTGVPEPNATVSMLAFGALGAGAALQRKMKRNLTA